MLLLKSRGLFFGKRLKVRLKTQVQLSELNMKLTTSNPQLRAEIRSVQSQLKTAIQNHQMILFKLKDRPVSIKLRVQMTNVQRHIVSLGEKQKKLLQELRKEMEEIGSIVKMEHKPPLKPIEIMMSNPVNQISTSKPVNVMKETEIERELREADDIAAISQKPATAPNSSKRKSKPVVLSDAPIKNGHGTTPSSSPSRKENTPSSTPSSSPTHVGSVNKQQKPSTKTLKQESVPPSSASDESEDAYIHLPADPELRRKLQFMTALSLVTREVLTELQNRRTERKRRSTANPQFLYGNVADPKRKKPLYLTSSSAGITPSVNVTSNLKEQKSSGESLACFECSSSNGSLHQCSSCQRGFHWKCVFSIDEPVLPRELLMCQKCQDSDRTMILGEEME